MLLNAEMILATEDLPRERVDVPEWGKEAHVFVRSLTAEERDSWESTLVTGEGEERKFNSANVRARLCIRCICDEQGKRIFRDDQVEALGRKSAKALNRIFFVAQRLNGIGAEEEKLLGKNLPLVQTSSSN